MAFRLLVVDADRAGLRATKQILISAGHLVACASSFEEAKRRLLFAPPDLLVTEVRLGAYNGVHLLARVREQYPSMPVIVMDVSYDRVLESEVKKVGATYVSKPLGPGSLLALVGKLVKEAKRKPSSGADFRFQRKAARVPTRVAGAQTRVIKASYRRWRLEPTEIPNIRLCRPVTLDIPSVGPVPIRPLWVIRASTLPVWWFGVEVAAGDQQTIIAWRTFVDSLN